MQMRPRSSKHATYAEFNRAGSKVLVNYNGDSHVYVFNTPQATSVGSSPWDALRIPKPIYNSFDASLEGTTTTSLSTKTTLTRVTIQQEVSDVPGAQLFNEKGREAVKAADWPLALDSYNKAIAKGPMW